MADNDEDNWEDEFLPQPSEVGSKVELPKEDDWAEDFLPSPVHDPEPTSTTETTDLSTVNIEDLTGMAVPDEAAGEIIKPWMRFHEFHLVQSAEELEAIVDRALAHGRCGLDLETQGFDNRIDYNEQGVPRTRHQIVGVCISVQGTGYYVPVRHEYNALYNEPDSNIPSDLVEKAIRRLCLASQPELTPEGLEEEPLDSPKWVRPPQVVIYFWNAKFDQEFLYPITGIGFWHPASFEDGQLISYCLYTDDYSLKLKDKARDLLRVKDPNTGEEHPYEMIRFTDLFGKHAKKGDRKFHHLHPLLDKNVARYGCSDAICTELLVELLLPKVDELKVNFTYLLEKSTTQVVRMIERSRTKIDRQEVAKVLEEAEKELHTLETQIKDLAKENGFPNFNPGSPKQLSDFLFGRNPGLDINPKPQPTATEGQFKTDAGTLEALLEENPNLPPVLQWILHYRQVQRIIGTYLERFLEDCDENDQLRFNFNQTGAATGRFTAPAGEPTHGFFGGPIQGIPARNDPKKPKVAHSLRRVFVAHDGYAMVKLDYAGQELRLVANESGEPLWVNEFLHGSGDLHSLTARAFYAIPEGTPVTKMQRNAGKTANFALVYGGGVQAVRRATGVDKHEAARQKAAFDKSVPLFTQWLKRQHVSVKKNLGIRTAFNRWIAIPDANIKPGGQMVISPGKFKDVDVPLAKKIQASCERKSVNYPIQGAGADVMKIALVRLAKELYKRGWLRNGGDDSVRLLMTIHDEIVFEVRLDRLEEAVPVICEIMESPTKKLKRWKVPLIVEPLVGRGWDAKHDWEKLKSGEGEIPDWLQGYIRLRVPNQKPPDPPKVRVLDAPKAPELPLVPTIQPEPVKPPITNTQKPTEPVEIAVFSIAGVFLTEFSQKLVKVACLLSQDSKGKVLRLTDDLGNILIDASLGIRVNPHTFGHELRMRNMGHGRFEIMKTLG